MWPNQFPFLICNVWRTFLSLTPRKISSFHTQSVQLIFSILHQHHISKLSGYFKPTFRNIQVSAPYKALLHILHFTSFFLKTKSNLLEQSLIVVESCFCCGNTAFNFLCASCINCYHATQTPQILHTILSEYQTLFCYQLLIIKIEIFTLVKTWIRTACSLGHHYEHFKSTHRRHLRDTLQEHQHCSIINMANGTSQWHMDCVQTVSRRHLIAKAPNPGQSTWDMLRHHDRGFPPVPHTNSSTNHRCDINFVSRALSCNTHCITWYILELKAAYQALFHGPFTQ